MTTGSLVLPNWSFKETTRPLMDPDLAIRTTIAAYLMAQTFHVAPGVDGFVRPFRLNAVLTYWPQPQRELPYPCGSVTGTAPMSGSNLTPEGLEDTVDVYGPGTAVWKLDEIDAEYQIDLYFTNDPEREAVASALPRLFAPNDAISRAWLKGPPEYLCWDVAVMLNSYVRNDVTNQVFSGEYRLTVRVQCSLDVIELRCTPLLNPSAPLTVVESPETIQDPEGA